jgi:hypothetical protein
VELVLIFSIELNNPWGLRDFKQNNIMNLTDLSSEMCRYLHQDYKKFILYFSEVILFIMNY